MESLGIADSGGSGGPGGGGGTGGDGGSGAYGGGGGSGDNASPSGIGVPDLVVAAGARLVVRSGPTGALVAMAAAAAAVSAGWFGKVTAAVAVAVLNRAETVPLAGATAALAAVAARSSNSVSGNLRAMAVSLVEALAIAHGGIGGAYGFGNGGDGAAFGGALFARSGTLTVPKSLPAAISKAIVFLKAGVDLATARQREPACS